MILFVAPPNLNFKGTGITEGLLLLPVVLLLVIMINVLYFVFSVTKGNMANRNVY